MLAITCVKIGECPNQPVGVFFTNAYQRVEGKCRYGGTLNNGCYTTDDDVLNFVLVQEFENLAKAGAHY